MSLKAVRGAIGFFFNVAMSKIKQSLMMSKSDYISPTDQNVLNVVSFPVSDPNSSHLAVFFLFVIIA